MSVEWYTHASLENTPQLISYSFAHLLGTYPTKIKIHLRIDSKQKRILKGNNLHHYRIDIRYKMEQW